MVKSWLTAALGSIFLASSTGPMMPRNERQPMKERPASSTREIKSVDIACVGAAVAARENSLSAAATTQTQAVATAYTARAAALNTAYASTDSKEVAAAVKKAWSDFSSATKGAKQTWQRSKDNSWKTYRESAKKCKGAESVTDAANVSSEQ